MGRGLRVDCGYRSGLGTCFYDRLSELRELGESVERWRVVIVYGPRGVGKSELVRYWLWGRRGDVAAVVVDARRLRMRGLAEALEARLPGAVGLETRRLVEEMLGALGGREAGLLELIYRVVGLLVDVVRERLQRRIVVLIDEFHMLPRYAHLGDPARGYLEALGDLEAAAGLLAKEQRYANATLVLTVSEGFAATESARSKLRGYAATWMLVEHLDGEHFRALHGEYAGSVGCGLGAGEVLGLVGGTPGYLPELCRLSVDEVVERLVPLWLEDVEAGLSKARSMLASQLGRGLEPREAIELAHRLLREEVMPLRDPLLHALGQVLTMYNVVYPVYPRGGGGIRYRPQYPVYRAAIELAYREGVESLLELEPRRVYEEAVGRGG